MLYVVTFFWCLPSPIIWLFNAEAWIVGHALNGVELPLLMAGIATLSQSCTFLFLYLGGEVILRRLPPAPRRAARAPRQLVQFRFGWRLVGNDGQQWRRSPNARARSWASTCQIATRCAGGSRTAACPRSGARTTGSSGGGRAA